MKITGIAGLSFMLAVGGQAQNCRKYVRADTINPLRIPNMVIHTQGQYPVFVDIDHDGDLDCYETYEDKNGKKQFILLRNNGTKEIPYFQEDTATGFDKNDMVRYSTNVTSHRFVDIDGDGDYDCFVGNTDYFPYTAAYYKNVGTKEKPLFVHQPQSENPMGNIHCYSYELYFNLADIDSDGDYDVTTEGLYSYRYGSYNYVNTGTAKNARFVYTSRYSETLGPFDVFLDWNHDGLTDFGAGPFIDINEGTPGKPKFVAEDIGPIFPRNYFLQALVDLNNDGVFEGFDESGKYTTPAPIPLISVKQSTANSITLSASPDSANYTYRWRKNGKDIPSNRNSTITVSSPGIYTVEISSSCGTGVSHPYSYKTKSASFVEENTVSMVASSRVMSSLSLALYPNPFTQQFTLDMGKYAAANIIIRISDVQGRFISTMKTNNSIMHLGGNLPKGIYIVQVMQDNVVVFTQKVIKE